MRPEFPAGPPDKVKPTGAPVDPDDLNNKPGTVECQATTGP